MEKLTKKKPLIIEFNGLPGSGKTTVANELKYRLKKEHFNITDLKTLIKQNNTGKYKKYFKLFRYGGWKLPIPLLRLFLSIRPIRVKRLKIISFIYFYFLIYNKVSKEAVYDAVVVDQGIIQAIISTIHLDKFTHEKDLKKLIDKLTSNEINYLFVEAELNEEISAERIASRNLKQGRFDYMKDEELKSNLRKQKELFIKVRENINSNNDYRILINTKEKSKLNVDLIQGKAKSIMSY